MSDSDAVITDVWTTELRSPLEAPLSTATVRFSEFRMLVVVVQSGRHLFGLGEVGAGHAGLGSVVIPAIRKLIEQGLAPLITGQPLGDVPALRLNLERNLRLDHRGLIAAALSGLDIALWDLKAKAESTSVASLLGSRRASLPVYATGGHFRAEESIDRVVEELTAYMDCGFNAVKLKAYPLVKGRDEEVFRQLRRTVGTTCRLAIDYSYGLAEEEAIAATKLLATYDPWFIETPVPLTDYSALAHVRKESPVPIAGNERSSTLAEFALLTDRGCVDIVQPSVIMCGGISTVMEIAELAGRLGLPVSLQCSGSAIALAATIQAARGIPNLHSVEIHRTTKLLGEYLPLEVSNGQVTTPEGTGLGMPELDIETLSHM